MFDPTQSDDDDDSERGPFPSPMAAMALTFGALAAMLFVMILLAETSISAAQGIAEAIGIGGVATLAARRIPQPQAERIGLRGFSLRQLPALLCLIPLVFLFSELDNYAALLSPDEPAGAVIAESVAEDSAADSARPEQAGASETAASADADVERAPDEFGDFADAPAEGTPILDPSELRGWRLVEIAIVMVGIAPVVESFLFFGVILQGLVVFVGRARALLLTGALYAIIQIVLKMAIETSPAQTAVAMLSFVVMGVLLSLARLATGSLLAPIIVSTGFVVVQLVAIATADTFPIPGFNIVGPHTPVSILLPSLLAVGYAVWTLNADAEAPGSPGQHPLPG
jgi:hypothetical protein